MIPDRTGRFPERPHYEIAELEVECERLVTSFQVRHRGKVEWPLTTEDLTCLIESEVEDLDLFADLSAEGLDVDGLTEFLPGQRPRIRISRHLSERDNRTNRLRTTLTHELGHVRFHSFLFAMGDIRLDLFASAPSANHQDSASTDHRQKCHGPSILTSAEVDWMEWQAGYACGAMLMPSGPLRQAVTDFLARKPRGVDPSVSSLEEQRLIDLVVTRFDVSQDAARVRLLKTGYLLSQPTARSLFS